jgi:hypothetical protein
MLLVAYALWECKYNSIQKTARNLDSHYKIEYQSNYRRAFCPPKSSIRVFDSHFVRHAEFPEETARGLSCALQR